MPDEALCRICPRSHFPALGQPTCFGFLDVTPPAAKPLQAPREVTAVTRLPTSVVALGVVSLFMDISSESIHSLLPAFLATVLGASALSIGVIEGVAEATASISRIFSGAISDWIGKRKLLVLLGYGLSAATKPLFPLASGIGLVLIARFADRIGKGIRGAPRDALIADVTPIELRGTAYGLRQSLDTIGAFVGPLLAIGLMALSGGDFRRVFWIAVIPAFIAVALIVISVKEPVVPRSEERRQLPIRRSELARFDSAFWLLVAVASALTLARFSDAFLLLAAQHIGMAVTLIPSVLLTMNVVYAVAAYPFGRLSDRLNRRTLLVLGIVLLMAADVVLAAAGTVWQVLAGAVLWGLHMGATQGLLSALVADAAPDGLRGTAFGVYYLMTGTALLAANIIAGALWITIGPAATFGAGAILGGAALSGLLTVSPRRLDEEPHNTP